MVANLQNDDIIESEFKRQSRYDVHFQTNALEIGMSRFKTQAMGWIVSLLFIYKDGFSIKLPTRVDIL